MSAVSQNAKGALFASAVLALAISLLISRTSAQVPDAGREPAWYARMIQSKAATAQQYTFDAAIELSRKTGEDPREVVAAFKVKVAVGPEHRYLFWLGDKSNLHYLIASDGRRTWGFIPSDNEYIDVEAIATGIAADPETVFTGGVGKEDVDPVLCAGLVVPILAGLDHHTSAVVDMKRSGDASTASDERDLPVLTVLSGRNERGRQKLTQLVLDPDTLTIARLNWAKSIASGDEAKFAFLDVTFTNFQLGGPIPASYFVFSPGDAQKLETLPIPGVDGASILDKAAPEFEMEMAGRKNIALSGLRGRTVLVAFSTNDCASCRVQSAVLETIQREYKERGLTVLEAGSESAMLHRLFHVRFVPTIVLIDSRGIVVRFLPGAQTASEIKAALQRAGL